MAIKTFVPRSQKPYRPSAKFNCSPLFQGVMSLSMNQQMRDLLLQEIERAKPIISSNDETILHEFEEILRGVTQDDLTPPETEDQEAEDQEVEDGLNQWSATMVQSIYRTAETETISDISVLVLNTPARRALQDFIYHLQSDKPVIQALAAGLMYPGRLTPAEMEEANRRLYVNHDEAYVGVQASYERT